MAIHIDNSNPLDYSIHKAVYEKALQLNAKAMRKELSILIQLNNNSNQANIELEKAVK